jgi:hypothetical protein
MEDRMTVSVLPKGSTFTRIAMAKAIARGSDFSAIDIAASRWGEGSAPARILKAAVAAGSTDGASWAGPLAGEYATAVAEFMTLVRAQSIIGRLPNLRRIPPRVPLIRQTSAPKAHWVGEGKPMPLTHMTFARDALSTDKLAAMLVVTDELLQAADPASEAMIRAELVRAITDASDAAFIDPTNAGVDDEQPASVTNDADARASSGGSAEHFKKDLAAMVEAFGGDLTSAYLIGRPELFVKLNAQGFENVGARGGEIAGIPALASRNVPNDADGDYTLSLIDPTGISYAADEEQAQISVSRQGSVQMSDMPDTPPGAGTVMVSLWQMNLTAIAAILHESWRVERPGSVSILTSVAPAIV